MTDAFACRLRRTRTVDLAAAPADSLLNTIERNDEGIERNGANEVRARLGCSGNEYMEERHGTAVAVG